MSHSETETEALDERPSGWGQDPSHEDPRPEYGPTRVQHPAEAFHAPSPAQVHALDVAEQLARAWPGAE